MTIIVISLPRSGSTFLVNYLAHKLGTTHSLKTVPHAEAFHYKQYSQFNYFNPESYLKERIVEDKILKLLPAHFYKLLKIPSGLEVLDDSTIILLLRRNEIALAISQLKALKSSNWLDSKTKETIQIANSEIWHKIQSNKRRIAKIQQILDDKSLKYTITYYEDICKNTPETQKTICAALQKKIPENDLQMYIKSKPKHTHSSLLERKYTHWLKIHHKSNSLLQIQSIYYSIKITLTSFIFLIAHSYDIIKGIVKQIKKAK